MCLFLTVSGALPGITHLHSFTISLIEDMMQISESICSDLEHGLSLCVVLHHVIILEVNKTRCRVSSLGNTKKCIPL